MKRLLDLPTEHLDQITGNVPASKLFGMAASCWCRYKLTKDRRLANIHGEIPFADRGLPGWLPQIPGLQIAPLDFLRSPLWFLDMIKAYPHITNYATCFEYNWNQRCYCPLQVTQKALHICDKRSCSHEHESQLWRR